MIKWSSFKKIKFTKGFDMINNQIKEALDIIYNIEVVNENPTF